MTKFYGLSFLRNIVETTFYSSYIKGSKPINLLIIAPPEHGKSELLLSYQGNKGLFYIADITSFGLLNNLTADILSGRIKYLIFPEFDRILSRPSNVRNHLISVLNGIVEDGTGSAILTKYLNIPMGRKRRYIGIIAALTPDTIKSHKRYLKSIGFLSRTLPIYYVYAKEDIQRIHELIKEENYSFERVKLEFPKKKEEIKLSKEIADKLDKLINILTYNTGSYTGFRLRRQLQTYMKASVLRKKYMQKINRTEVTIEEVKEVYEISPFTFNPLRSNECDYLILKHLNEPMRTEDLIRKIEEYGYKEKTIRKRLRILKEKGLIKHRYGWVEPIISLKDNSS